MLVSVATAARCLDLKNSSGTFLLMVGKVGQAELIQQSADQTVTSSSFEWKYIIEICPDLLAKSVPQKLFEFGPVQARARGLGMRK